MVKILFLGDTHLDIERPAAISRQRKIEFQNVFKQIIDFALSQNVDLLCHLGDLFDKSRPYPTEVRFVLQQLLRLADKNIKFYVIRGNHEGSADIEDLFRGWAGDYVKIPNLHNVQLIDPKFDEARHLKTVGYRDFSDSIRIYGIGYYRGDTLQIVKDYIPLNLIDQSKINILLMHCFIDTINSRYSFTRSDPFIPADDIIGLNFNLIALGHSHSRVEPIKRINSTFFSPGSPIDWKFNHLGSRGFYLVEIDENERKFSFQWHEIDTEFAMKFITIDGKSRKRHKSWFEREIKKNLKELMNSTSKKLILGFRLKGTYSEDSPRFQIHVLRALIQDLVKDRLFYLGPISLKGLQYKTKKEVDIETIRETKMGEEEIFEILNPSVGKELANILVNLYKQVDEAYMDKKKLTSKKMNLKSAVKEELQELIDEEIKNYYGGKISEADLKKIKITPVLSEDLDILKGTIKSNRVKNSKRKKRKKQKGKKGLNDFI